MEQLLTTEQLAELLNIPVSTVYKWSHRGGGPTPIHVGRHLRYRPTVVDAWLESREVQHDSA